MSTCGVRADEDELSSKNIYATRESYLIVFDQVGVAAYVVLHVLQIAGRIRPITFAQFRPDLLHGVGRKDIVGYILSSSFSTSTTHLVPILVRVGKIYIEELLFWRSEMVEIGSTQGHAAVHFQEGKGDDLLRFSGEFL